MATDRLTYEEFAKLVRSNRNPGYLVAVIERSTGEPITDKQIANLYRTYMLETGYDLDV